MRFWAQGSHWKMWRSVPQTEAVSTAMRTSSGPMEGTGTSRISMPGAAWGFTRARMVLGKGRGWTKDVVGNSDTADIGVTAPQEPAREAEANIYGSVGGRSAWGTHPLGFVQNIRE